MAAQLEVHGIPVPKKISFLSWWNPLSLQKQVDDLKSTNAGEFFLLLFLVVFLVFVGIIDGW